MKSKCDYILLYDECQGWCMMHRERGFWQQCTKWYWYLGNLKRFCPCYKEPHDEGWVDILTGKIKLR